MNARLAIHRYRFLAAGLLVSVPLLTFAGPPTGAASDSDGSHERGDFRPGAGFHDFSSHEHGWGWGPHPAFLEGLKLTEEQEDKVFAILHAAAPGLRVQAKAAAKANEGLRELGTSAQLDDARAKALTDAAGKAESQLELLHIRAEHEIYLILSTQQRAEFADRRRSRGTHDHDHDHEPSP